MHPSHEFYISIPLSIIYLTIYKENGKIEIFIYFAVKSYTSQIIYKKNFLFLCLSFYFL